MGVAWVRMVAAYNVCWFRLFYLLFWSSSRHLLVVLTSHYLWTFDFSVYFGIIMCIVPFWKPLTRVRVNAKRRTQARTKQTAKIHYAIKTFSRHANRWRLNTFGRWMENGQHKGSNLRIGFEVCSSQAQNRKIKYCNRNQEATAMNQWERWSRRLSNIQTSKGPSLNWTMRWVNLIELPSFVSCLPIWHSLWPLYSPVGRKRKQRKPAIESMLNIHSTPYCHSVITH